MDRLVERSCKRSQNKSVEFSITIIIVAYNIFRFEHTGVSFSIVVYLFWKCMWVSHATLYKYLTLILFTMGMRILEKVYLAHYKNRVYRKLESSMFEVKKNTSNNSHIPPILFSNFPEIEIFNHFFSSGWLVIFHLSILDVFLWRHTCHFICDYILNVLK